MNVLLAILAPFLIHWQIFSYTPKESAISFRIQNAGITVKGTLEGLQADIRFDPQHLEKAKIDASVAVNTIKTGITLRDMHLQKRDYFFAQKYPRILLSSKAIRKIGNGRYEGVFILQIKDMAKEVRLPFTVSPKNEFEGSLTLNRLDYQLGRESLVLANLVEVFIRLKLKNEHKQVVKT